jgi:adenylate cyclase
MTTEKLKTRHLPIRVADAQGFSRLVGEDETWAARTLQSCREFLTSQVLEYSRRIVEAVGDKLVAVQAVVAIKKKLKIRNAQSPEDRRMTFRMGGNLGEVNDEGEKISGEGVQVAVKVEGVAAAGRFSISGATYDCLKNELHLVYQYAGIRGLQHKEKPVRVYRVFIDPKGFSARASIWKGEAVR